jgi:hypothetical protein
MRITGILKLDLSNFFPRLGRWAKGTQWSILG